MSVFDNFDKNLPGDNHARSVFLDKDEYELFPAEEEIFTREAKSFWFFYVATAVVFIALIVQLLNLQITHGAFNRILAEGNRIRNRAIAAPRGVIYDSTGKALVANDGSFSLQLYPVDLPRNTNEREIYYANLSSITLVSVDEIKGKVKDIGLYSASPVILKENIERDEALLMETKIINFPGVVMSKKPVRRYSEIPGLAPVLGYIGKATQNDIKNNPSLAQTVNQETGKDGLEKIYQNYLVGKDGASEIEVNSSGKTQRSLTTLPPQPGNNLILSINADLEDNMAQSLAKQIEAANVKAGAAVAINPQTGAILALVSMPTYDNNIFSQGINVDDYNKIIKDPNMPMFDRAIAGAYPSGSTIKPLVAAAGLQEGVITENTTLDCPAEIKVGSWTYPDWKYHGLTDVKKAIAESVNIYFYAIGGGWDKVKGIGPDKMKYYFEKFGLGAKTGIDLPGEVAGLIPDPTWKKKTQDEMWYLGDSYHMAIGQGDVLTTPLQMAVATAAVANGGQVLKPQIVDKITNNNGELIQSYTKQVIRSNFIDANNLRIVRDGMRQTVTNGSATSVFSGLTGPAAAKTGTAQFNNNSKTHGWMVAYAPYDNPQIAVAIIVEGGGEGYATAGPVAKTALQWYFDQNK